MISLLYFPLNPLCVYNYNKKNEYLVLNTSPPSLEDHNRGPPPLGLHVARRFYDNKLHLVFVCAVERMRDQLRHLAVGTPTHLNSIHFQDHVTHLQSTRIERRSCVLEKRGVFIGIRR